MDDLERRRALGQFFTPLEVARFVWEMLELLNGKKLAKGARVIDPACGEGVFLHAALERGRGFKLFGADIDESLAPKWRADASLKDAKVALTNGLVDDPKLGLVPESFDLVVGNPPFAGTGLKELLRLLTARGRTTTIQPDLFDTPTTKTNPADPPILFPAERARLDRLARVLSAYDCWRFRRVSNDDLDAAEEGMFETESVVSKDVTESAYDRAARVIAEWPANQLLDVSQPELRGAVQRMAGIPIEAYFVERFVRLTKPGGLVAMIVPDSILSSDQYGPLRSWLLENVNLLAVVSLPHKVFSGVGAKVRTGIMFARRYSLKERQLVEATPPSGVGTRFPKDFEKRETFMIMPSSSQAPEDWNLKEFLDDVQERVQKSVKYLAKE